MSAGIPSSPTPNFGSTYIQMQQGVAPMPPANLSLLMGSVGIHSVTVYNSSACQIVLFPGQFTPGSSGGILVPAYTSSTIPIANAQVVAVGILGTPASNQDICYLHYTDQDLVALSTPTGTNPGPATSTPWQAALTFNYVGAGPQNVTIFQQATLSYNKGFYLTDFYTWGLAPQKIGWSFNAQFGAHISFMPILDGFGDARVTPATPVIVSSGLPALVASGANVTLVLNPAGLANGVKTPVRLYAGGYYV